MRIHAVRARPGGRDRFYVHRDDGSEASWSFPSYGSRLPHDLVHYAVEVEMAIERGLWGLVAAGIDIARVNDMANRQGGKDKYAALGDRGDILRAEALAVLDWESATAGEALRSVYEQSGLPLPRSEARAVRDVRRRLTSLHQRWLATEAGRALVLSWPGTARGADSGGAPADAG